MAQYIDTDKIVSSYWKQIEEDKRNDPVSLCAKLLLESVIKDIEHFPTTDVKPLIHAHWFLLDECSNAGVYCSNCHKKCFNERAWYRNVKQKSRYCPNCGARMDEVTANG